MATVFIQTATAPDSTGRYRCSLHPVSMGHTWSEEAIADYLKTAPLPSAAMNWKMEDWQRINDNPALREGYMTSPGDVTSHFMPERWAR